MSWFLVLYLHFSNHHNPAAFTVIWAKQPSLAACEATGRATVRRLKREGRGAAFSCTATSRDSK